MDVSFRSKIIQKVSPFTIRFFDRVWVKDNNHTLSLMCEEAPYKVEIAQKQWKIVKINTTIALDTSINYSHYSEVHIIIQSDRERREV